MCLRKQFTFHDLLCVVSEELTEWGPLRPLQGVEQLLDLRGHSAVYRNSYKQDEVGEGQWQDKHTVTHKLWFVHTVTILLTIS